MSTRRGTAPPGPRKVLAVVPFGARGPDGRAGIVGRQLARRLVERFADHDEVELRPVFLVALPAGGRGAEPPDGYLVFGSTPDPELAARYGASADAILAVILSPACSSFDMFRDYKHRADVFRAAVSRIVARERAA